MANFVPLGPNRKWNPGGGGPALAEPFPTSAASGSSFPDACGEIVMKPQAPGTCRHCGYSGHLPYQCRNTIPLKTKANQVVELDISSTSTDSDHETPLTSKEGKKVKKMKKKELKRLEKKLKKELKEKSKKSRKRRRHSSSASSSSESSTDSERKSSSRRRKKSSKKSKKHKK